MSSPAVCFTSARAAAFGASAVTNIELVTAVAANAVHMTYEPIRRAEGPGSDPYRPGNAPDDGEDGPRAAGRVRRRARREGEVGQRDGVAEAEGPAAQPPHQPERDAAPEPRLAVADREHERAEDEPHRPVLEPRERPRDRRGRARLHEAADPGQRHADEADRRRRDRLQDQADDDGGEEGEVAPGVPLEPGRHGNEGEHQPHDEGRGRPPPLRTSSSPPRSSPRGGPHLRENRLGHLRRPGRAAQVRRQRPPLGQHGADRRRR